MLNAKVVIAAVFALTLSSGVVAGMLVSRLPSATPTTGSVSPTQPTKVTPLAQALGLGPDQQVKMQAIWERVRDTADGCYSKAQELQRKQWEAMAAVLTPEQKAQFNGIQSEYQKQFDELKEQRQAEFKKAVSETDLILTGPQRQQFHDLIEKRLGETPPWLAPLKVPLGDSRELSPGNKP